MLKQIFTSNLKNKSDCWNKRLREALKNKGYTQTKFAKELGKRSGTDVSQAMVSDWMRVGNKTRNNQTIGFPKYSYMVLIAEVLNVDVGYLTGETNMETFTSEKICGFLNISEEALKTVLSITGTDKECMEFGYQPEKYRKILNNLFTSPEFTKFIEAVGELEDIYTQKDKSEQDLYQKYSKKIMDIALKYVGASPEENIPNNLCEDEIVNLYSAIREANEHVDLLDAAAYRIKVCKYEIQQLMILLINGLYPYQ